jgi:hypothetical protein
MSVVLNGDVGRYDEIEEVAIPQISLDDSPTADQGTCAVTRHGGVAASSLGHLTRSRTVEANTNDVSTRRHRRKLPTLR